MAISGIQIGGTHHIQGLCKGICLQKLAFVLYLHFRILEFLPIESMSL